MNDDGTPVIDAADGSCKGRLLAETVTETYGRPTPASRWTSMATRWTFRRCPRRPDGKPCMEGI